MTGRFTERFLRTSPLRHPQFRRFYTGSVCVALGYTMQATIAAWLMATLTPSALMVALVALLNDWHRLNLTEYQVADLAVRLEREELGIPGGLQDQYAAVFGGFNFI